MNETPEIIEEIIAYKKAHLHIGEYDIMIYRTFSSRFGERVKSNKFMDLVEKTLDI